MPIRRDPDSGDIHDAPTRKVKSSSDAKTKVGSGAGESGGNSSYDARTVKAGSAKAKPQAGAADTDAEPKTRIYRGSRKSKPASETATADQVEGNSSAAMDDPLAGWLVVIAGPGQGNCVQLGYGSNSIGRDSSERISLDFGDDQISRTQHAVITYDPRGRNFYLQHGGGKNLTYLNDEPVLAPTLLDPMINIQIADTTLRFVPFCNKEFDWHDIDDE